MVQTATISEEVFKKVSTEHCTGWDKTNLEIVRMVMVKGQRGTRAAEKFSVHKNTVYTLCKRFMELVKRDGVVKVGAKQFMVDVPTIEARLAALETDIRELAANGYSTEQIEEFLRRNDIEITTPALKTQFQALVQKSIQP